MKKVYTKPLVYAETFELLEHVAGDCLVNDGFAGALHRSSTTCGYRDKNVTLFSGDVGDCAMAESMFSFAGVSMPTTAEAANAALAALHMECYNSFLATGQLFAS